MEMIVKGSVDTEQILSAVEGEAAVRNPVGNPTGDSSEKRMALQISIKAVKTITAAITCAMKRHKAGTGL